MPLSQTQLAANHCNVHARQHTTVTVVDPGKLKCLLVLLLLAAAYSSHMVLVHESSHTFKC